MCLRTVVFDFPYSILSFPCLRAGALQRAGVETGIQAVSLQKQGTHEWIPAGVYPGENRGRNDKRNN